MQILGDEAFDFACARCYESFAMASFLHLQLQVLFFHSLLCPA